MARQRQKLVADFGVTMHIAWARHMLDNREFVIGGGTQPSTEPIRAGGVLVQRSVATSALGRSAAVRE